jgi:hypothetical protein
LSARSEARSVLARPKLSTPALTVTLKDLPAGSVIDEAEKRFRMRSAVMRAYSLRVPGSKEHELSPPKRQAMSPARVQLPM